MLSQRFVTFQESEPSMEFETVDDDDELTDADEKARATAKAPMWDDDEPAAASGKTEKPKAAKKDPANRKLHSHQTKKSGRGKRR